MHLYFAFGMNLTPETMGAAEPVCAATLNDWGLRFHTFADIEPAPGERVVGGVWRLTDEQLHAIDRREGYIPGLPPTFYDRITVTVQTADGPLDCLTYRMTPLTAAEMGDSTSSHYLDLVIEGRAFFGLHLTEGLPVAA